MIIMLKCNFLSLSLRNWAVNKNSELGNAVVGEPSNYYTSNALPLHYRRQSHWSYVGFDDYKNNYYIIFISNSVEYYTQMEI